MKKRAADLLNAEIDKTFTRLDLAWKRELAEGKTKLVFFNDWLLDRASKRGAS